MPALHKFDTSKQKVFFSSDFHGYHKNICLGTSEWTDKSGCRNFPTIEAMNEAILFGINSTVGPDDVLIFLGDWTFGGADKVQKFRDRIVCAEIHWVLGNHDQHCNEYQDLFEDIYYYWEMQVDKQMMCLMHYPIEEWNDRHRKSWMLHGHSHTMSRSIPNRLDVGVDSAFKLLGEYRPFSFEEVSKIIKNTV